jgi:single-strand DNA-binding protein
MLNKIMLIGNLGKDPEFQVFESGTTQSRFSLAVSRMAKDRGTGERTEETQWFTIILWGKLAETCEKFLHKGSKVYVEGRLEQRKYTDKKGIERVAIEVHAQDFQMLSPKAGSGEDASDPLLEELSV